MEFGYEHPDLLPPYCTVCKRLPLPECSDDEDEFGTSWCATSDPTVTSSTRIWFRIFDMLGVSGNQGKVCYDCHDLVEQFDVAKSQLKVLQYLHTAWQLDKISEVQPIGTKMWVVCFKES